MYHSHPTPKVFTSSEISEQTAMHMLCSKHHENRRDLQETSAGGAEPRDTAAQAPNKQSTTQSERQ